MGFQDRVDHLVRDYGRMGLLSHQERLDRLVRDYGCYDYYYQAYDGNSSSSPLLHSSGFFGPPHIVICSDSLHQQYGHGR
jgi:hypothetical protein